MKPLLATLLATLITTQAIAQETNEITHQSVQQALNHQLQTNAQNMIQQNQWTVFVDDKDNPTIIWSFTPQSHYAHPSLAKRQLIQDPNGQQTLDTTILCEAPQEACEQLQKDYQTQDQQRINQQ